jgi:hypothetical protein
MVDLLLAKAVMRIFYNTIKGLSANKICLKGLDRGGLIG